MPKHPLREHDHDNPRGTWVCASCSEEHDAAYDTCWKCGTSADGRAAADRFVDRVVDFDPTPAFEPDMAQAFPGSIGMTHDGQPIYRVVGYTAEGTAVTADKVANSYNYSARTNGTAVASLILGLVCPPLAIPFGHIARQQILDTGERGDGLAIAGLVLGYVSIALCAIAVLVIAL